MSNETTTSPVIPPPPAPVAAPVVTAPSPAPEPPKANPFAVFPDSESFNERMDREARSRLKALGVEDPDALKALMAEHAKLKQEAEAKRLQEMSDLEREREARAKTEAELAQLRAAQENAALEASLFKLFAEEGVKNFDYATFAVTNAMAKVSDKSKFDPREVITRLKADPAGAAALGINVAPVIVGATTTTADEKGTPPPAPGGEPPQQKSVHDMTPEEFRAHVQKTAGFSPR